MHVLLLSGLIPFAILALILGAVAFALVVSAALAFPLLPLLGAVLYGLYGHRSRSEGPGAPCQPV